MSFKLLNLIQSNNRGRKTNQEKMKEKFDNVEKTEFKTHGSWCTARPTDRYLLNAGVHRETRDPRVQRCTGARIVDRNRGILRFSVSIFRGIRVVASSKLHQREQENKQQNVIAYRTDPSTVTVRVRTSALFTGGDELKVSNVVVHENFNKFVLLNDIALIKVTHDF